MVDVKITTSGRTLRVNGKFRGVTAGGYKFNLQSKKADEATVIITDDNASGLGIVASMVYADDLDYHSLHRKARNNP